MKKLAKGDLIIPASGNFQMAKANGGKDFKFQYAGAKTTRFRDFLTFRGALNESQMLPYFDRQTIISRLRQLIRDDAYAAALCSAYPTQIGTSTMSSLVGAAAEPVEGQVDTSGDFNDAHERAWLGYSETCEYTGLSLCEMESILWREDLIAGEIFFLKLKSGKLQMIPSEYCFSAYGKDFFEPGSNEMDGLVVENGQVTGYRFGYRDGYGMLMPGKEITPAENVIHFFFQDRPEQRRGVPRLAPVLNVMQDIYDICGAKVMQVKTQSFISGVVTKNMDPAGAAEIMRDSTWDDTRSDYQDIRGGVVYYMETGEDMKPFQSNTNSTDFDQFLKSRLEAVGGAVGMPPECWIEGFRDSNYSSARATVSTWIRTAQARRYHCVNNFLEPVHDFWVEKNPRDFADPEEAREVVFTFPGVPAIDEGKQNDADSKALAAGLTTYAQVYGGRGMFWDTQFKQIQREQQRAEKLGLVFNYAPNSAGNGAPGVSEEQAAALAQLEKTKATADAFGVAVRAGAVTPSEEDEDFMREQLGVPKTPPAVKSVWAGEKTRRPITIAAPGGGAPLPAVPAAPVDKSNNPNADTPAN